MVSAWEARSWPPEFSESWWWLEETQETRRALRLHAVLAQALIRMGELGFASPPSCPDAGVSRSWKR